MFDVCVPFASCIAAQRSAVHMCVCRVVCLRYNAALHVRAELRGGRLNCWVTMEMSIRIRVSVRARIRTKKLLKGGRRVIDVYITQMVVQCAKCSMYRRM